MNDTVASLPAEWDAYPRIGEMVTGNLPIILMVLLPAIGGLYTLRRNHPSAFIRAGYLVMRLWASVSAGIVGVIIAKVLSGLGSKALLLRFQIENGIKPTHHDLIAIHNEITSMIWFVNIFIIETGLFLLILAAVMTLVHLFKEGEQG